MQAELEIEVYLEVYATHFTDMDFRRFLVSFPCWLLWGKLTVLLIVMHSQEIAVCIKVGKVNKQQLTH